MPSAPLHPWGAPLLCLALLAGLAPTPAPAQSTSAKRPITHADYDGWKAIQGQVLSPDGKFLGYAIMPQEGDGELVLRNLESGQDTRYSRGTGARTPEEATEGAPAAPPTVPPAGPRGAAALAGRFGRPITFTADSKYALFQIIPTKADIEKARKENAKPEELSRPVLGILNLATGALTKLDKVRSFQVPDEGSGWLIYQLETRESAAATAVPQAMGQAAQPARGGQGRRGGGGGGFGARGGAAGGAAGAQPARPTVASTIILRNLDSGHERKIADVGEFSWSKDGKTLVYVLASKQENRNGVYVLAVEEPEQPRAALTGKGKHSRLTWDEKQTKLAFLSDRDDAAAKQPKAKIYTWERKTLAQKTSPSRFLPTINSRLASFEGIAGLVQAIEASRPVWALETVSVATTGIRKGLVISERANPSFSEDGKKLYFSVAPEPANEQPKQPAAAGAPAEERVSVDLWHWKDDFIQPMQKLRGGADRTRAFQAVAHLSEKKVTQLGDETMGSIFPSRDGNWALGGDDRAYRRLVGIDTNYSDYYLVNTSTGGRKPLLQKQAGIPNWSPGGKYILFYDGRDWNTVSVPEGKTTNLTRSLGVPFYREDDDHPSTPPPWGSAGWTKNDQSVLLYDRYDIWEVAPNGSKARNLTAGMGRREKISLRYVRLDPQEKFIADTATLLLKAEHETTRDAGFFKMCMTGGCPQKLVFEPREFTFPTKAKKADVLLYQAHTFAEFPDLMVSGMDFSQPKKVSNVGAQKDKFIWGTAELVSYKNMDGVPLQGVLLKPENFDPSKKYPMLVYIYERLSQGLHSFHNPAPGTSINSTYYISNGYLVFMPDIVYTVGYPGQSAIKSVLPAIQAVVDRGCVDEKAIGIQGHSWGGYQIAYMVTQTNRFKAVAAGAAVSNMTSAYSGIRWGTGLPRQFQYEKTQSRIGGSLWQYPTRFIENSPVFMADRVQTPVLLLHNDQDDAVPWYQGIEYFLALRRLDKEVYMFNYNGELHGLRRRANQKDYTVRMQQFFDYHLRGKPKPDWMEKGIPYQGPNRPAPGTTPAITTAAAAEESK